MHQINFPPIYFCTNFEKVILILGISITKNHETIFCLILIPFLGISQQSNPEQRIATPIKAVTLYLGGAEINQQKMVNLNARITSVVFANLSSKLIQKSIQVNVGEGISVLSVSEKTQFFNSQYRKRLSKTTQRFSEK